MVKIAADTPVEILTALKNVDAKAIDPAKLKSWLATADKYIGNFIPKRTEAPQLRDFDADLPKKIVDYLNNYCFACLRGIKREMYLRTASAWLKSNLPMKK